MSGRTLLRDHLAPSIAKALAKVIFGVPVISDPLVDFLKEKLQARAEINQAERQIGRLVDQCLVPLKPLFIAAKGVNLEALALALGDTVERHVDVKALIKGDLDHQRVQQRVTAARSLKDLQNEALGHANIELYRRTLPPLLGEMISIAPKLQGFEGASTAEILKRLTEISDDTKAISHSTHKIEAWIDRQEEPWRDYASKYQAFIAKDMDVVQLFGIKADATLKRQRLSTNFVPLSLSQEDADEGAKGSASIKTLMGRLST